MTTNTARIIANITAKVRELGISEGEVSRRSGVPQPTIHRMLAGETKSPRLETLTAVARAVGIDLTSTLVKHTASSAAAPNVEEGAKVAGRLPLISWVQAGSMAEAIDLYAPGVAEEWLESPWAHSAEAFCLTVRGISMYPDYRDGEIIMVEPGLRAEHGDDVIARTPDGEVTFKRLQISEDGQYLLAVNPDFPDRIIRVPEGTVICGVVVGSWIRRRTARK